MGSAVQLPPISGAGNFIYSGTYAWTSARSHAHHLIHYATASLTCESNMGRIRRGASQQVSHTSA
ncbi:hypothetical protein E2C01_077436 [Portunus trituberculatus]|uniref:Uncharacterized protein n=1 Tax=Portunus trituberculatus TaxID=210409 RepID=A0A5B7IRC2_PORTR|nr:hypothetical protein [Portunus trituberculatus]